MFEKPFRFAIAPLSAAIALAMTPSTYAETESVLEEIVVTAQKREQSVQDLGISVAAFSGDTLQERGIDNLDKLFSSVPNVQLWDPSGGGIPLVNIRGIGTDNARANNSPAAAIYVDDVYLPSPAHASVGFFDIARIEVLKGPQGGLYGRNTTAGAIQVITGKPNFEEIEGSATLGYGRFDRVEMEGVINVPINDQAALRIAGRKVESDDTFYHSITDDKDHGEEDKWAVRAKLALQPTDNLYIELAHEEAEDQSETPLLRTAGIFDPATGFTPCAAGVSDTACVDGSGVTNASRGLTDEFDALGRAIPQLDNDLRSTMLRVEWGINDDYTLTSITAGSKLDHGRIVDFNGQPTPFQDIDYNSEIKSFSQEFRLAFNGSDSYSWVAGFSYIDDTLDEASEIFAVDGPIAGFLAPAQNISQVYEQETEAWAVYGHFEYALQDNLNLVVEGRWTEEEKTFEGGTLFGPLANPLFTLVPFDLDDDWSNWSGKIGLDWNVIDSTLLYASVSRGYKSGGFNGNFATSTAAIDGSYDEETVVAYEVGIKSDVTSTLRANASIFYYDYKDQQSEVILPGTTASFGLLNIGDVEVDGAELELTWLPIEAMTWLFNVGYTNATIVDSDSQQTSSFFNNMSIEGQNVRQYSNWNVNTVVSYEIALGDSLTLTPEIDYTYRSKRNLWFELEPAENDLVEEGSYGLTNVRLILSPSEGNWKVIGWANNVEDKRYRTLGMPTGFGQAVEIFGPGNTYGVTATYKW